MSDAQQPLIIKDFNTAVADSPHKGHALMRNIDIELFPGAMKVQKKFLPMMVSVNSGRTFTADPATDICSASGDLTTPEETANGINYNAAAVTFTTTGTLPAGLSLNTVYFLLRLSNTTFQVTLNLGNALAGAGYTDITDTGTGVHTIVPVSIGSIKQIIKDSTLSYKYAQDSNGRVWHTRGGNAMYLLTGNTLTGGEGNGLQTFKVSDGTKTYLFVFRNAAIDVIEVTSDTTLNAVSWTNSWKSLNSGSGSGNPHTPLLAQDNIVYFPDARYVGSILENAGSVFDPGSAGTYTFNNQALDMPQNEIISSLDELGSLLYAGGLTFDKVYPWDRISDSFGLPLNVGEKGIYKLKNIGSVIYILAGTKGNIYRTQGTYVELFKTVPGYLTNPSSVVTPSVIAWGGVAARNGALIFGMSSQSSANSGIYILYPDGRILKDNTPYGGAQQVHAIYAENDFYTIGYAGSVDYLDTSRYAAGTLASVYQSALYRVGNKTEKATYSSLEIQTATAASTGQLRMSWRPDKTTGFTQLDTFTADSVATSFEIGELGLIDLENIQFQVEFDGNFEIMEIRAYP